VSTNWCRPCGVEEGGGVGEDEADALELFFARGNVLGKRVDGVAVAVAVAVAVEAAVATVRRAVRCALAVAVDASVTAAVVEVDAAVAQVDATGLCTNLLLL